MRLFIVEHNGHWLGGVCVVSANDEVEALEAAKGDLAKHGVGEHEIGEVKEIECPVNIPTVIYLSNGDY